MTVFLEGEHVDYVGDGLDGIPPAQGRIMAVASKAAVHVEWLTGPRQGQIDLVEVYDLEKSASVAAVQAPTVSASVLVRRVMHREGSAGVLRYLAALNQLISWEEIAEEALRFVESRLKVDASMDLPYETLTSEEIEALVRTSAVTLLRDKFGEVA
jgi:hypothetical protein